MPPMAQTLSILDRARSEQIIVMLYFGATYREAARAVGVTARHLRRLRNQLVFLDAYGCLRGVYGGTGHAPPRIRELERRWQREQATGFLAMREMA